MFNQYVSPQSTVNNEFAEHVLDVVDHALEQDPDMFFYLMGKGM